MQRAAGLVTLLILRERFDDGAAGRAGSCVEKVRTEGGRTRSESADRGRHHVWPFGTKRCRQDVEHSDDGGDYCTGFRDSKPVRPAIYTRELEEGGLPAGRARTLSQDEGNGSAPLYGSTPRLNHGTRRQAFACMVRAAEHTRRGTEQD